MHPDRYSNRACKGADREVFFRGKVEDARRICNSCPVAIECLEWAVETERRDGHQMYGVWGGLTKGERAELVKEVSV